MARLTLSMPTELGWGAVEHAQQDPADARREATGATRSGATHPSEPAIVRWFACWSATGEC